MLRTPSRLFENFARAKTWGVMASNEVQQQATDEEFVEVWVAGQPDASQKGTAAAAAPPQEEEEQQDSSNCAELFSGCCSCSLLWLLFVLGWVCPPIWLIAAATWGFTSDRGRRVRLAVLTPSDRAAWLACSFMACASVAIVLGCSIYYGSHKAAGKAAVRLPATRSRNWADCTCLHMT